MKKQFPKPAEPSINDEYEFSFVSTEKVKLTDEMIDQVRMYEKNLIDLLEVEEKQHLKDLIADNKHGKTFYSYKHQITKIRNKLVLESKNIYQFKKAFDIDQKVVKKFY